MVKASTEYKRAHKADYGREKIELLYHDQWIAVINKPSGLLSVPYPGSKVRTAQSVLEEMLRKQGEANSKHKPYVVHRLDRDTSGVMMFALTEQAQEKIMNTWHTMVTERLYHALAEIGRNAEPLPESGLIDDPLAQNAHNVGFVPKKGDKDNKGHDFKTVAARTHYKMLLQGPSHILFELSLDTGKIRFVPIWQLTAILLQETKNTVLIQILSIGFAFMQGPLSLTILLQANT